MREMEGDLWDVAEALQADAVAITTNGFVKKNGEAVMGRGVALEAKQRWADLPRLLGVSLKLLGNHVHNFALATAPYRIVTFPVKLAWFEKAEIVLITRSVFELDSLATMLEWKTIVLPRPGCGNGGLDWADVRPVLAKYLDDRFVVVHKEELQ